jgi:phosphoglycolate phosphatase-like HAD superfamily hydrolase
MASLPRALLLDFGGVIVDDAYRPGWASELAQTIHTLLGARRVTGASAQSIAADLASGLEAYGRWCDGMSRPYAPSEVGHEQFWADFIAPDWPAAAREVVLAHSAALCQRLGEVRHAWHVRPGMPELLAYAAGQGMLLAVVSNTLYGSVHRDFLERVGLADWFAVQLYSDEVGVRKPNPELILRATRSLAVGPEQVWFVGDTRSRDVRCGRRARVAVTVLMQSARTPYEPASPVEPDHTVADPVELLALLKDS